MSVFDLKSHQWNAGKVYQLAYLGKRSWTLYHLQIHRDFKLPTWCPWVAVCWTWSQSWEEMPQSALGSWWETAAPYHRLQPTASPLPLSVCPVFSRGHIAFSLNILLIIWLLFMIHLLPHHTPRISVCFIHWRVVKTLLAQSGLSIHHEMNEWIS